MPVVVMSWRLVFGGLDGETVRSLRLELGPTPPAAHRVPLNAMSKGWFAQVWNSQGGNVVR